MGPRFHGFTIMNSMDYILKNYTSNGVKLYVIESMSITSIDENNNKIEPMKVVT